MLLICIWYTRERVYVHMEWVSVLLFGLKGNTRASVSGTAIVQSRFFVVFIEEIDLLRIENV